MKKLLLTAALAVAITMGASASTVIWDGSSTSPSSYSNSGDFSSGGTISGATLYTNSASGDGGGNYGAIVPAASSTAMTISFTLSDSSATFQLDSFSFLSRSTTTGPTTLSLSVSNDGINYTTLWTGSASTDSVWSSYTATFDTWTSTGDTVYIKIDGARISTTVSSSANWRVDSINLGYSIVAVPEPETYALLAMGGVTLFILRKKLKPEKDIS